MTGEQPAPRRKAMERFVVAIYLGGTVVLMAAVAVVWLVLARD